MNAARAALAACLIATAILVGCSNGRGSVGEPAPAQGGEPPLYSVSGTISGLAGSGLVLRNNDSEELSIAADGSFTFPTRLAPGTAYAVAVAVQPSGPSQTCTVSNGSGSIGSANITDISVTCATGNFSVGGVVTGLTSAGLVLSNNGSDDVSIGADGSFVFPSLLVNDAPYNVTVRTQPTNQNCIVRNASGRVKGTSVTDIQVSCASNVFTIGGDITGLTGEGLRLRLNDVEELSIVASGAFAFETAMPWGAPYEVSIIEQPVNPTQRCSIDSASGSVSGNVTNVAVTCTSSSFAVGGTVSGLQGAGLTLQLDADAQLPIQSNGSFTFPGLLPSGTSYRVSVIRQPSAPQQQCTIANARGTIGSRNVTNVRVTCAVQAYSVGGTVTGLMGSGLVLQNNGADFLSIDSNGAFEFAESLAAGASYNVSVRTQPDNPRQACTISRARGTVESSDITTIAVNCATSDFTVGGTVRDLEGTGLVLRNNGGDDLTIDTNGPFTFDTVLPTGASYNITIAEQPRDPRQACSIANASGVISGRNITDVVVRCSSEGYRVGGHVSKLRGSGLVLQNNGGDDLAIASNGSFDFPTPLPTGSMYNVTVRTQPSRPTQRCSIMNSTGFISNSNIQNVEVKCRGEDDDDDD